MFDLNSRAETGGASAPEEPFAHLKREKPQRLRRPDIGVGGAVAGRPLAHSLGGAAFTPSPDREDRRTRLLLDALS